MLYSKVSLTSNVLNVLSTFIILWRVICYRKLYETFEPLLCIVRILKVFSEYEGTWDTRERQVRDICDKREIHVRYMWETREIHVRCERHVRYTWDTRERHVKDTWYMRYTWDTRERHVIHENAIHLHTSVLCAFFLINLIFKEKIRVVVVATVVCIDNAPKQSSPRNAL